MPETLQSPSCIKLFGRLVTDLNVGPGVNAVAAAAAAVPAAAAAARAAAAPPPVQPPYLGANLFLQQQLGVAGADAATIARIYGFAYEGHYYDLARPALFLVHGPGQPAERPVPGGPPTRREARAPDETDRSGVAATPRSFSEDMMVWAYDKGDFSIRMDVETGTLQQILLEPELNADRARMTFAGQSVRLRSGRGPGTED